MRTLIAVAATMLAASAAAPASAQNDGYGQGGDIVRCESNDGRTRECPTGGGRAVIERQLSRAPCVEGRTWGSGRGGVWVSQGCRADFRVRASGWGDGQGQGSIIRCESDDGRTNRCMLPGRGRAQLVRQLSRAACSEGRSWGSDNGSVWVSQGCRGEFAVVRGSGWNGSGHGIGSRVFRCESNDGRRRECAANTRAGVQMVRQLSNAPCVEGRTWGYGRNGIWVAQGCRAEFRTY